MPATVSQTTICTHLGVRLIGTHFRRVLRNNLKGLVADQTTRYKVGANPLPSVFSAPSKEDSIGIG